MNSIITTVGQMNGLLGAALTIIGTYKAARAAWKQANPDQAGSPFLEDSQLADLLMLEGAALTAHVDQVLAKYSEPGDAAADSAGGPAGGV